MNFFFKVVRVIGSLWVYLFLITLSILTGKRIVIMAEGYGQLGNRLIHYIHMIQFAMKHRFIVFHPSFADYSCLFEGFDGKKIPSFPQKQIKIPFSNNRIFNFYDALHCFTRSSLLRPLFSSLKTVKVPFWEYSDNAHLPENQSAYLESCVSLDSSQFLESIKKYRIVALNGWRFRVSDFDKSPQFHSFIKDFFLPVKTVREKVESVIGELKMKYTHLVGVHIRRKDYRTWLGGRFFYNFSQITEKLTELNEILQKNGEAVYIIFSDEKFDLPEKNFNLNVHLFSGNLSEDLYALSLCNYIIGPPSTFSGWASYYGQVPIYKIFDIKKNMDISNFKKTEVWNGVEIQHSDGKVFIL